MDDYISAMVIYCTDDDERCGFYETETGGWWDVDYPAMLHNVIAWMPLPEPYRGKEGGTE